MFYFHTRPWRFAHLKLSKNGHIQIDILGDAETTTDLCRAGCLELESFAGEISSSWPSISLPLSSSFSLTSSSSLSSSPSSLGSSSSPSWSWSTSSPPQPTSIFLPRDPHHHVHHHHHSYPSLFRFC